MNVMQKSINELRYIPEDLGWSLYFTDSDVELRCQTPAGEDYSFCVPMENFVLEVRDFADGFDYEEHVRLWLNAKESGVSGVPDLDILVEDAHTIKKMLEELATRLENNPTELCTFPDDDKNYCKWFKVDLKTVLDVLEELDSKNNNEGVSLRRFLDNYVWEETLIIYEYAKANKKILMEGVIE